MSPPFSTPVATPPKNGGLNEFESHADKHRKNLNNDRLNDLTICCSDGMEVRCQSYMLRVASEVFEETLSCVDLDKNEGIIESCFSSFVMKKVKHYCHLGHLPDSEQDLWLSGEMDVLLDALVAADFYHIDEFGAQCLERVTKIMVKYPNLAFVVIGKVEFRQQGESRPMVASAIAFARKTIGQFELERLAEPFIGRIAMVRDREGLNAVLELIMMTTSRFGQGDLLLPLLFMEAWVLNCIMFGSLRPTDGGQVHFDPAEIAKELLREIKFLEKIAALRPTHLIDSKGVIRRSKLVDVEYVMEAIYSIAPHYSFVEFVE
jgi:hypothetical protein